MSSTDSAAGATAHSTAQSPEQATEVTGTEELEAQIEVQREQLAGTIDALSAKLDVKSQAQAKVADVKAHGQAKVVEVRDRATTPDGKPRPELLVTGAAVVLVTVALIWWRHR